ncbi:helix-turn-helix transcriptional regulator [Psychromicrobium lacuslunae]|uniref:HTH cro/C1-type domain-containing protein n=1 Tax=Psychromicrobium lacuslunae TaxID=1618207 RepID=A0A0D4C1F1_9MICC|nr:helix-turn-helix transcriptional regulator [Psychromicrobium lacuslunae]AJT42389.1 hypothetical protein UM93_14410 [Psychromicrobium lacuslunae]
MNSLSSDQEKRLGSIDWGRTSLKDRLSYGSLIRDLRIGKNITQEGLAEIAGVSRQTVSNIESGKTAAQPAVMESILRGLGVGRASDVSPTANRYLAILGPMIDALDDDVLDEAMAKVVKVLVEAISDPKGDKAAKSSVDRIGRLLG